MNDDETHFSSTPATAVKKRHEDWGVEKKDDPRWVEAGRHLRGWPMHFEVTEEEHDLAVHEAQHVRIG